MFFIFCPEFIPMKEGHIFLKHLPTYIAHIAKATQANAETKALSKSAILSTHQR